MMSSMTHKDFTSELYCLSIAAMLQIRLWLIAFSCPLELGCRSRVNIPFRIGSSDGIESLEKKFLQESADIGMISLKGHR